MDNDSMKSFIEELDKRGVVNAVNSVDDIACDDSLAEKVLFNYIGERLGTDRKLTTMFTSMINEYVIKAVHIAIKKNRNSN